MLKVMFDSNVWDQLLLHEQLLNLIQISVNSGEIEIHSTSIQEVETSKAPRANEFVNLRQMLNTKMIPSSGIVLGYSFLGQDLLGSENSRWVTGSSHSRDEVIAETCETFNLALITQEKKRLRNLAKRNAIQVFTLQELCEELAK